MRSIDPKQKLFEPRIPPFNIQAEQALLGAILLNNDAFERVADVLGADHFYDPLHARIFATIQEMIRGGSLAVTPVTLRTYFEHEEPIGKPPNSVTVPEYLWRLAQSATSIINAPEYAKTVKELWIRRQIIAIGEDAVNLAYETPVEVPVPDQISETEGRLFALGQLGAADAHDYPIEKAVESTLDTIEAAFNRGEKLSGLPTGFKSLDQDLGGLSPGDLIILAGRPSMGKSALAAQIGFQVAEYLYRRTQEAPECAEANGEVLFASLEMSAEQLMMRQLAVKLGIPVNRQRLGDISQNEFERIIREGERMRAEVPFHIDSTGAISLPQLVARARRRARLHNLRLLIVDYLQLMSSGDLGRNDNRVTEITRITTGLKAAAKELRIPIIALSQLSRQVETREDKRPQLSDLRESGSIEQDADIVLFVFREEYYIARAKPPENNEEKFAEWMAKMDACEDVGEVIRGKHRHGSVGVTEMRFEGEFTRFSTIDDYNERKKRMRGGLA